MDKLDKNAHIGMDREIMAARQVIGSAEGFKDPTQLGPLVLAYVGDTVFDLYVRTELVRSTDLTAHGMHVAAAKRVCAAAQAAAYKRVAPLLTEEEAAVFRRGRNSHIGTVPKHAAIGDYRAATGLEAVIGWLYLRGDTERMNELMAVIMSEGE